MNYLLSLVVPTKNKYIYLEKLVDLVISFSTNQIELIIQDNSDDNQKFIDFVTCRKEKYPWIKYFYESHYLTSIENFDLAISRCNGEYVCFIGDDDGVVRNIIRYVEWMKQNNVEALRSARSIYYWSGKGRYTQYATFEPATRKIEWLSPIHELKKVLNKGGRDLGKIPVLYTGIVKKSVLDTIYKDLGTYFPGVSPDAAIGTVLSFYVKRYAFINTPIIITGTSKETGGGLQQRRIVPFHEVPFLRQENFNDWEGTLPSYWTSSLVWPVSIISALRKLGKQELLFEISFNKIIANFYLLNKDYKSIALQYANNKMSFYYYCYYLRIKFFIKDVFDKSIRILSSNKNYINGYLFYNLNDILEAENLFYEIDKKRKILEEK